MERGLVGVSTKAAGGCGTGSVCMGGGGDGGDDSAAFSDRRFSFRLHKPDTRDHTLLIRAVIKLGKKKKGKNTQGIMQLVTRAHPLHQDVRADFIL